MNISKINDFPKVEPRPENIPDYLKVQPWAVWTAEPKTDREGAVIPGKFNKAPRVPTTGIKAGADRAELFGTYQQAVDALQSGRFSGFGPILTGNGLVGVDIDQYETTFDQMPQVKAWVAMARSAGAYCEVSPSGTGLRLYLHGGLPGKGRKVGCLEIYGNHRFMTTTGKRLKGCGMEAIDGQDLIDRFLSLLPAENAMVTPVALGTMTADPAQVETLCRIMAKKEPALWDGDWKGVDSDLGGKVRTDRTIPDRYFCGEITRQALKLGVPDEMLVATVCAVYERSGMLTTDNDPADRMRKIANHAAPKAVGEELQNRTIAAQVMKSDDGADLVNHEPGDIQAGRFYAKAMRSKMLYVSPAGKWLWWDGTRWVWCSRGEEMAAAKMVAAKILDQATALFKTDPIRYKRQMGFATALQNLPRLEAMIKLAKSEEGMSVGHMSELDADPWLLGVRNGVVNLKDGGLLAADPKMLITRQVAAEYHDDALCPNWETFLDEVFEGDQETSKYVQRAEGYTLTGTTTEEALFIGFGHGANGKSVFANVTNTIMADYARAAPASLLTVRNAGDAGPRNDLAMLCGARQVSINETTSGDRLDEQIVKQLAGREMISARFLNKEFFDFWPTAKPWLRTNHKPIITGEDDGIWRRLHLIPFRRKFAEHERDPWLESKLLEERDGILAWMVRGCLEWQRIGLKPSATVRRESASYRKESDLLGEFLDEKTVAAGDARVGQDDLFRAYRDWHDGNGTRPGSKNTLSRKLAERGYGTAKSNGRRYYTGVKLALLGLN